MKLEVLRIKQNRKPLKLQASRFKFDWGLVWQSSGALLAAPSIALAIIIVRSLGFLQLLEWAAYDQFMRLRPLEPPDPRIAIVAVEESDIQKVGRWPIPDLALAELLEKLNQQQPLAIGLDIYRDLPVEPGYEKLVEVVKSTPNLIGVRKVVRDSRGAAVSPPRMLQPNQVSAADMVTDVDGKVRRGLLSLSDSEGKTILSLGTLLALIYLEAQGITPEATEEGIVKLGRGTFIRFQENDGGYVRADGGGYQILLNYRGTQENFEIVSMTDILEDRIPPDMMRDRLVLIGTTAQSLNDLFYTPYSSDLTAVSEPMPGVAIHANIASQLLSTALDGRPSIEVWSEPLEWLWILAWSCVGVGLGWKWRVTVGTVYSLFLAGGGLVVGAYLGFLAGWWIPVAPALLALAGSASAIAGCIANVERQDRQMMMNLFGQNVTPKIAEEIWRSRRQLLSEGQLVGQKMTATVVFTDLKSFSTISEHMDPAELMSWLNEYMSEMIESVLHHDGVVDKLIGDAVMAVFGVPIPRVSSEEIATDAIAAVSCVRDMGRRLRSLNQRWHQRGRPTVAMRVGIATGMVVAGSLGSHQRLNYTTIGDCVNVAARLESYDKSLDGGLCRILISEQTYQYVRDVFPTEAIGVVQLKGRSQQVKVYQVLLD